MASDDDSDFYGDDTTVEDLQNRVEQFDVRHWWETHGAVDTPMKIKARGSSNDKADLHNPFAGIKYAWQLTESVDAFLDRLPPAFTSEEPGNPWIWICNPYIKQKAKQQAQNQSIRGGGDEAPEQEGADLLRFVNGGVDMLDFASSFINELRSKSTSKVHITRETRKAGADAAEQILNLATHLRWMIFCSVHGVNDVWEIIAKATANNELGIAAKVAPKPLVPKGNERLICVYTKDFSDRNDVVRVAERLKALGLTARKPLYYKPDAYTYLGIASQNPWVQFPGAYELETRID
ncbi:hypothetical protein GGR57DRAFT_504260 [Xylariaceae sp. FL1272]|nr:hypothetical protein GGR57DRAFT_504260 [Xylariaceae sp. FL1272]